MGSGDNTLLLRLAGPMQSWGTSSRLQLRRTDAYPSKSGVLGLLLCAKGVRREDSPRELEVLASLVMGVRIDRPGVLGWDYHTAGAGIGVRKAEGGVKKTASTREYETLVSRRQYLFDASFLVALQGATEHIASCVQALEDPVWPIFLGRKSCPPAEPVLSGSANHGTVAEALAAVPWRPRTATEAPKDGSTTRTLDTFVEHLQGTPPPHDARLVHDVPREFGFHSHGPRFVVGSKVTVPIGSPTADITARPGHWRDPYGPGWEELSHKRLELDNHLCVFCKSPAQSVHHTDYRDVRVETLRSLCENCHDACTMLEYSSDLHRQRVDPSDPALRPAILLQIARLLSERRLGRRRGLLETARATGVDYFDDAPGPSSNGGR